MAKTKLFIRANEVNRDGTTVVYLRYSHADSSVDLSTKIMIAPKEWDAKNQQVRKSCPLHSKQNAIIQKRKIEIEEFKLDLINKGIPPMPKTVKELFNNKWEKKQVLEASKYVLDYWDDFFKHKQTMGDVGNDSLKQYKGTIKVLRNFESFAKIKLTFEKIDNNFYDQFKLYAYDHLKYHPNTFGGRIKNLKSFMSWANDKNITTSVKYKKFKKTTNESISIALTQEQLDTLYYLDLSGDKRLEKNRDLLVLGCATGLRFSDFSKLNTAHIKQNLYIEKHISKTNETIMIPLNDYSRGIIAKYPTEFPKVTNSDMNKALKEIGILAGFFEIHEVTKHFGGKVSKEYKAGHELLVTHTARRTFCTQSYHRGMALSDIMKISGHKSIKQLLNYIKNSDVRLINEMKKWNSLSSKQNEETK